MCLSVRPARRDIGEETRETLQAQVDLAPDLFAAEAQYRPQYAELERQLFIDNLLGSGGERGMLDVYERDIAPAMGRADAAAAEAQRSRDVEHLERYGARAAQAIQNANPDQAALMRELNAQVMGELRLGAEMDPSLRREVAEAVRSAQSARGFGTGLNDATQEAFARGLRAEELRRNRQRAAMGLAGLNQATSVDPGLALFGRPTQANPQMLNYGMGAAQGARPGLFDPQSPYASQLYSQYAGNIQQARMANQQVNAQLVGSAIESVGAIAGGAMAFCWVAREVYGEHDDRWKVFREWMLNEAPVSLKSWYLENGARVAEYIADKPALKAAIREWMDAKIAARG